MPHVNIRRRLLADGVIACAIVFVAARVVYAADLPEAISFVVAALVGGLCVHDTFQAGFVGRPLWRWSWLDGGVKAEPGPPGPR